jgi:M6 family metalloprotease-like protein
MSFRVVGTFAIFFVLGSQGAALWAQPGRDAVKARRAARAAELRDAMRSMNAAVLSLAAEAGRRDAAGERALRSRARQALNDRAAVLRELIRTDAAEALRLAFSPEATERLRKAFPDSSAWLEQHGEWEGPVETLVIDEQDLAGHEVVHYMETSEGRLEVRMAGEEPDGIECGKRVRFRGVRAGEVVAAMDGEVTGQDAAAAPACGPKGQQSIAVLLVTFPGVAPPSDVTPEKVHTILFGTSGRSLHGYWNEASYGQVSATGTVLGWYTLDQVYSCDNYYAMRNAAIAAADPDIDFRNYNRLFIIFPNPGSCSWAGLSNVGCGSFSSADGTISASSSWMLAQYFSGTDGGVKLAAHEGGHALGLMHSRSRRFNGEALGPLGEAGTVSEYGDVQSAMGSWNLGHYTAEQKVKLGWLPSSNVLQVQAAGTFTIQPLEVPAGGAQALQVQRGTGNNAWLWLEYRQPLGNYDTTLNSQIFSGALIHYKDSVTGSYTDLLDFTPSTSLFNDASLAAGASWQDPYTNVSLTVTGASATGISVNVSYGSAPCVEAAPTLTVSPPNPSTEPGKSAGYTVTLNNNDSGSCGSRSFSLGSTKPQGWPTSFSAQTVTLAPGQSMNVTMTKTVPSTASPGTYEVDAIAETQPAPVAATASLTVLPPPPPPGPLSVTFNQSVSSVSVRTNVQFSVQVLSGSSPAAGASVTFTIRKPDGSTSDSRAVKADSNGIASWSYRFQNKDPKGTYMVTATASYNGATASATTSVTLQ